MRGRIFFLFGVGGGGIIFYIGHQSRNFSLTFLEPLLSLWSTQSNLSLPALGLGWCAGRRGKEILLQLLLQVQPSAAGRGKLRQILRHLIVKVYAYKKFWLLQFGFHTLSYHIP